MEPRRNPPEYFLEIFADTNSVKDVLKGKETPFIKIYPCHFVRILILQPGVLHLIFFHRYFPSIRPGSVDILDLTLPTVNDVELETLIDSRANALIRQHLSTPSNSYSGGNGVRGRIAVEFFERKRKKAGTWFGGLTSKGEEEVCWEIWTLDVTIATPRTESGMLMLSFLCWKIS